MARLLIRRSLNSNSAVRVLSHHDSRVYKIQRINVAPTICGSDLRSIQYVHIRTGSHTRTGSHVYRSRGIQEMTSRDVSSILP